MLTIEPAFPRGSGSFRGRGETKTKPIAPSKRYGAAHFREHKASRLRPKNRRQVAQNEKQMDEGDVQQALNAMPLSIHTIMPGMLVLGCVKLIKLDYMEVTLPGRVKTALPITNISDEYSARLQQMVSGTGSGNCPKLKDMYNLGDLIYVKVLNVCKDGRTSVIVSVKPNDLHGGFAPAQLVPGLVLAATIVAKEDHGYLMNVGIRNVRAFLPDENLGENRNDIGRNIVCTVEQVSQLSPGATIVLKAFNPNSPWVLHVEEASLETVVPGCRLPFTVAEPVEHGLRGMIFEDTVPAYVNELMLTKVTSTPAKYSMFKKLSSTLLYVMPRTKQVFVSLRPYPNNRGAVDVADVVGTIIEKACVKSINRMGVFFQFGKKQRALLQRNVLLTNARMSGNVDENVVMDNFLIGTTHKVSVVSHDPLMDLYIVNNNPDLVDSEIRSVDDIIIGKTYNSYVSNIVDKIVFVNVGLVKGSVEYELYDSNNELKPKQRALVRAVFRTKDGKFVRFTNHPLLLSDKAIILQDWDQLDATQKDQRFHGIVCQKLGTKVVVKFFNNMTGTLHTNDVSNDPAKVAHIRLGTVQEFTVASFNKAANKIQLILPYDAEQVKAVVVDATISCIHATGADVETDEGETGTIPSDCFSEFGVHNSLYMRLLEEGQTLSVIKTKSGTYSFRLKEYFKTHPMQIESVVKGGLLKGSCIKVNGTVYATPLLNNFSLQVAVAEPAQNVDIPDGSTILMRVQDIRKTNIKRGYNMKTNEALEHVCEKGIDDVYNFVAAYMKDVDDLIQRYRERQFAFANFTIGQSVECVIERVVPNSEKLAVEVHSIAKKSKHAAKGIATAILRQKPATSYKVGSKVPGRVVWIDVERTLVHVCLDQPLLERIALNDKNIGAQTVDPQEPQYCWVLFANSYVQICCPQDGAVQLWIVPVKHHYNDFTRIASAGNTVKVKLIKPMGSMFLAMGEEMILKYSSLIDSSNDKTPQLTAKKSSLGSKIRRQPAPEIFNEDGNVNYSNQSETEHENKQEVQSTANGTEHNDEDTKAKKLKKGKVLSAGDGLKMLGKDGKLKSKTLKNGKLKRKLADEPSAVAAVDEANGVDEEVVPIKKKKQTNGVPFLADPEQAVAKKQSKKSKKAEEQQAMPSVGKKQKPVESTLKKKKKNKVQSLVIDQLDGVNDFYLHQLDGMEDGRLVDSSGKQSGAKKRKHTADTQGLPGASNFWDSTPVYRRAAADTSDDESDSSDGEQAVPKKRTTAKERFEAMKQEEERLRKIEEELANPSVDPHTPDQFDRLVLAQPNNSMLWIRYMAFHMESAELEKARAVGRKALKAIHFREETDRLNVWIALLNLEIRYETVDSFKEVLQEAIQYNDAFKVYTRVIDILVDCQKHAEVQELLELLLKKFRKQNDMWYLVADAWYRIGQGSKVKPLLSQALKSLPTRDHIPLIVKFAFLHNRNENRDEAHLLFEQILTSYPKRTDIWSQYIDMLVKDNLVGNARQILERAIMQRLPLKNMKTLYTKYVNFEEKHGDRDSVRRVKQMASDYVQAQLNNAGIKG